MGATTSIWKLDRVKMTLLLSIIFITCATLITSLNKNLIPATLVLLGVITLLALWKKYWFDAGLALVIALALIIARLQYDLLLPETFMYRFTAIMAFLFLHLTLLIGPLSRFFVTVRKWYKHRRHLGVATFLLALFHVMLIMHSFFDFSLAKALVLQYIFFGAVAFGIMFLLAITSFDFAQTKIKLSSWYVIHLLSFAAFIGISLYFIDISKNMFTWQYIAMIGFAIGWLLFAPWGIAKKIHKRVNGWKQIHFLVYIAYISMIIHVWTGRAKFSSDWIQITFWVCIGIVFLAHLSGWVKWLMTKMERKKSQETLTIDGQEYHRVGKTTDFEEGKGKEVRAAKTLMAIFKHEKKYIAISARCPHQGGPIAQGKIEDGYVVCPLHQWQYSIENGLSPEGFNDCIPYYDVIEKDGAVYVALTPSNSCVLEKGQYVKAT